MATTFMDVPAVQKMTTVFDTASDILKGISMALEAAMMILKVTAFIGLFGAAAVERYLAQLKPKIDKLQQKCDEMGSDLREAVKIHQQASQRGDSI